MPASAYHDAASGSIERGNALGERSSVRQSRYFRQYESGNNVKSLLGTDNLCWDVERKEGVFQNHAVYDGRKLEYAPATFGAPPPSQQYFGAPPPSQQYYGAPPQSQQYDAPPPPQQTWQQYDPPPPPQHTLQQNDPPPPQQVRGGRATMSMSDDALWSAVGGRDMAEVQRLLRQGSNPNMICPDGWVKDECRPKDGSVGRSLLHHAAWAGDLGIFKLLVDSGAEVDRKRNTAWRPNGGVRGRGSTALHHACQYNRQAIVSYLIDELGCDINAPGEQGYTPLHLAAKFNYPRLVEYLLQRGARTDMLTRDEKTPRDLAAPRQERSSFQMGDMLELFDKYDRESRSRPKLLPGAPLPPDPRLHAHEGPTGHVPYHEAPPTSAAAARAATSLVARVRTASCPMVVLQGLPASSREYLESTDLMPALEAGLEEMLRKCADTKKDPINFLASFLMRSNPRHNAAFAERIQEMRAEAAQRKADEAAAVAAAAAKEAAAASGADELTSVALAADVDEQGKIALSLSAS